MRYVKGEIYFPIIIGVHFVLWAIDLSLLQGSPVLVDGESPVQRVLGEVLSSWVITVIGFNLLMTTRLRWVERIFGGLDKMYVIHRRSGIVAGVLLLLHFGIVPRHPEFSIGKPLGFVAMALMVAGIAFAAAPLMKRKIPYHKWLGGHRLMGIFFVVGVAHSLNVPTLISQLPLVRTYVYGMATLGVVSWIYCAFLSKLLRPKLAYAVTAVRRHGKSVVDIRLVPAGKALEHQAGQFAFFSFDAHSPREWHPFTIASPPGARELRIAVKASGDFTSDLVANVAPGDEVRVDGPFGLFTQGDSRSDEQIWIAGGIGITPFLALAPRLASDGKKAKLVWSVRTVDDAPFDEELTQLAQESDCLEYELWRSNERGYLTIDAAGGSDAFHGKDVFICGPTALRDGLEAQLKTTGVSSRRFHSEEFAFR